jgi:hypothetical protein
MAIDYDALAATARRLVDNAGKDVVVRRLGTSAADPSKPWRGATGGGVSAAQEVTLSAVSVPPASMINLGGRMLANDELAQRLSAVYIAATAEGGPEDLSGYDELVDGSSVFRIVELDTLRPADKTLLYFIGVEA